MHSILEDCRRYLFKKYGNKCYRLLDDIVLAKTGEKACISIGGNLVSIPSITTLEHLEEYLNIVSSS